MALSSPIFCMVIVVTLRNHFPWSSKFNTRVSSCFDNNKPDQPFRHSENHIQTYSPWGEIFFFYKVVKLESSREKMGAAGKSVEFQSESYYFTFRRSAEHCNSPNCNYNRPPLLLGWMVHRLYLSAAQLNAQKRDRPGQGFTQQGNCCGSINRLLHFFFFYSS